LADFAHMQKETETSVHYSLQAISCMLFIFTNYLCISLFMFNSLLKEYLTVILKPTVKHEE